MTRNLNIDEYESTLTERMANVTGIENRVAEFWPYVKELAEEKIISKEVFDNKVIEIVYQNENNTFEHVLLPTENTSVFIVVIIDLMQQKITGHYRQDLNEVYGLT